MGSVLAPAELIPAHPVVVRSPLEGVVDRIHVHPNDRVAEGQSLFRPECHDTHRQAGSRPPEPGHHMKTPRAGLAVFDDPSERIGRPVAVGEKVMMVAGETDTEIEAWLNPADVGEAQIRYASDPCFSPQYGAP